MPDETELERMDTALERLNQRRWWIWGVFFLASSPGVFNAYHIMVSLFFSHIPTHWCKVPELVDALWTNDQIRNISSPNGISKSSCSVIAWNYTQLATLGYEGALDFISSNPRPAALPCHHFMYEENVLYSTTVSEWDLVCDRLPLKSSVQSSISLGKFFGGFIFGFIADKYGRKTSFVLACMTYIITGPLAAFAPSYWFFVVTRFFIGISGSGCYESAYTILTEVASKDRRAVLGCVYNMSYPIGYMTLSLIALMFPTWRSLQLAISLPMILLLVHCWFLPESPRWLLTQGRHIEAWAIVKAVDSTLVPAISENVTNVQGEEGPYVPLFKRILDSFHKLFTLFETAELGRRICISYFTWFVAALSYYVLALNADNFSSNRYIYLALTGLVEVPSYVLPLIILMWLGRKSTAALLYLVCGVAFISILFIPQEKQTHTPPGPSFQSKYTSSETEISNNIQSKPETHALIDDQLTEICAPDMDDSKPELFQASQDGNETSHQKEPVVYNSEPVDGSNIKMAKICGLNSKLDERSSENKNTEKAELNQTCTINLVENKVLAEKTTLTEEFSNELETLQISLTDDDLNIDGMGDEKKV